MHHHAAIGPKRRADAGNLNASRDDVSRWVLDCHSEHAEHGEDALGRYLRFGKQALQANEGYLASRRKPWYGLERRENSPILFTYMNRERPRFIRNRAAAVPLNTFLIIEPSDTIDVEHLWQTLRSQHFMRRSWSETQLRWWTVEG